MHSTLNNIASISSGITVSSKHFSNSQGAVKLIQMRDLGDDNVVAFAGAMGIAHHKIKQSHILQEGDLVFRSRGHLNTAAIVKSVGNMFGIVATPLLRIRPNINAILPEFLLWWINQPTSQAYFERMAKGSTNRMITKDILEHMEVHVPSIAVQHEIINLHELTKREQYILGRMKHLRELHSQEVLYRLCQRHM